MKAVKVQTKARTIKGVIHIIGRKNFDHDVNTYFPDEDNLTLTLEKTKKQRSLSQNAFHWGVIIPLMKDAMRDMGNIYTDKQIHDYMRSLFLKVTEPLGKEGLFIERIKSSTELSTSEWMDWNTQITIWCAEFLHLTIPEPNSQQQLEIE